MLYAILFVGMLGADSSAMEPKVVFGPFDSLQMCAAAGALGINELNAKHPDKDFRIDCAPTNEIKRRPGANLYDLTALRALARVPFAEPN